MKVTNLMGCCYQNLVKAGYPNPSKEYDCPTCGMTAREVAGGWESYRREGWEARLKRARMRLVTSKDPLPQAR